MPEKSADNTEEAAEVPEEESDPARLPAGHRPDVRQVARGAAEILVSISTPLT